MMEFIQTDEKIPATEWFKLIIPIMREGYQLKICPKGRSMIPFLVGGRDEAVLSVPGDDYKFKKNDIVLYKLDDGLHVLHRICRINKKGIYILGDFRASIEGPFRREDIIAVADYIIRKGKRLDNSNRKYILCVKVWRLLRPFRLLIYILYSAVRSRQKSLS